MGERKTGEARDIQREARRLQKQTGQKYTACLRAVQIAREQGKTDG